MMRHPKFSTHVLDEADRTRDQRLEAERASVLEAVVHALRSEGLRLGLTEAWVVGSLARSGEWTESSDVDVAVSGADPLEIMKLLEGVAGRTVDVVDLGRHPEPDMFRRRGERVVG